jgi:hypothetical protein
MNVHDHGKGCRRLEADGDIEYACGADRRPKEEASSGIAAVFTKRRMASYVRPPEFVLGAPSAGNSGDL